MKPLPHRLVLRDLDDQRLGHGDSVHCAEDAAPRAAALDDSDVGYDLSTAGPPPARRRLVHRLARPSRQATASGSRPGAMIMRVVNITPELLQVRVHSREMGCACPRSPASRGHPRIHFSNRREPEPSHALVPVDLSVRSRAIDDKVHGYPPVEFEIPAASSSHRKLPRPCRYVNIWTFSRNARHAGIPADGLSRPLRALGAFIQLQPVTCISDRGGRWSRRHRLDRIVGRACLTFQDRRHDEPARQDRPPAREGRRAQVGKRARSQRPAPLGAQHGRGAGSHWRAHRPRQEQEPEDRRADSGVRRVQGSGTQCPGEGAPTDQALSESPPSDRRAASQARDARRIHCEGVGVARARRRAVISAALPSAALRS